MKVLITGALGLLGKVATQTLVDAGHQVTAIDRIEGAVPVGVKLHVGDIEDLGFVRSIIGDAEAVVHLAAIPSPQPNREYEVFRNNVLGGFAVFNAAADAGCRIVAYASSMSAYGTAWSPKWTSPLYAPFDESHPLIYSDSYALSKEVNELTALEWSRRCDTTFVGFRFPNTNTEAGLLDFARKIHAGDPELVKTDAKIMWAYLDTRDAAAALELTIRSDLKGNHIFNIAQSDTNVKTPTAELFAKWHPTTELRGDFSGFQTPVSSDRWIKTMGYLPKYFINKDLI